MSILAQLMDIVNAVACSYTRTKLRSTNIHGVGTVVNRRDAALQILGRCQQFQSSFHLSTLNIQLSTNTIDIVRCLLINVVVDPVAIEKVRVGAPTHDGRLIRVVIVIIVDG